MTRCVNSRVTITTLPHYLITLQPKQSYVLLRFLDQSSRINLLSLLNIQTCQYQIFDEQNFYSFRHVHKLHGNMTL